MTRLGASDVAEFRAQSNEPVPRSALSNRSEFLPDATFFEAAPKVSILLDAKHGRHPLPFRLVQRTEQPNPNCQDEKTRSLRR
jgi:hypothetical protein